MDPWSSKYGAVEVECSVCGGPGVSRARDAWFSPAHINPSTCRYHLDQQRRELEKQKEAMVET